MITRKEGFTQLSSSFTASNKYMEELIDFACDDISSQCGFEGSGNNVDFLVCIDQLEIPKIRSSKDILRRARKFLPEKDILRIIENYKNIHHIWLEFDSKANYELGGIFICFKSHVYGNNNSSKIRSIMKMFDLPNEKYKIGMGHLSAILNNESVTLTEIGYMPGRENCPIRLCLHTGQIEQTKCIYEQLFKNTGISIDKFFSTTINPELVEHYFLDIDLHESSIEFNGIEIFPLTSRSFKSDMFKNLEENDDKTNTIFKPSALHLNNLQAKNKQTSQATGNYLLRRTLNHVKYTAKSQLKHVKYYISIEYIYMRHKVAPREKEYISENTGSNHFDDWSVLHQANNLDYLNYSRTNHTKLVSNLAQRNGVKTIRDGSLWEINNWINDDCIKSAYTACLNSHNWSFSNKGNDHQIVPSWWITESFPKEVMIIIKSIKNKFLELSDTNHATRTIVNGHTSGFADYTHQDLDFFGQGLTCLVFLNDDWNAEYDGDFKIYYEKQQSISIMPSLGKLVIFDGAVPHRASAVSREFTGLRLTIALQYNSVAESGKLLTYRNT